MPHLRLRSWRLLVAGSAVLLGLTGCGDSGSSGTQQNSSPESPVGGASGQITVFAAASLTEAFTEIETGFEEANPDADVQFNFAGSSTLAQQINQGAPVDVFASASPKQMQAVINAGNAAGNATGEGTVFVENTLQIVVPAGNPAGVTGLTDFGKQELAIALCAEQVPCGAAALQALLSAGVTPAPDTLEQDVKAVLTKVMLNEADAGLVYRTDVLAAGSGVEGIDFPEAAQAVNEYPIVALAGAPNAEGAQAFVDYVLSDDAKAVLEKYGFGTEVA